MDHHMPGMSGGHDCKIKMMWNWYTIDACFLSPSWHITSHGAFAASCIGVLLMAAMIEVLRRLGKEYDEWVLRSFQARVALITNELRTGLAEQGKAQGPRTVTFRASPLQQLFRAGIHAVTFGLAYIVMLLAMYYNGYIIICIFLGAGIGKFLCDWMTKTIVVDVDANESKVAIPVCSPGIEEPTVCCG